MTAKIIDLGLAKPVIESHSDATISLPGVFAGTPAVRQSRAIRGSGLDIRSDLYSLGVTLWKMLTGQVPFRGSAAEVMHQHQRLPCRLNNSKVSRSRSSFSLRCSLRRTRRDASRAQPSS